MFGQITDMAAALMATAMDYQNKFGATGNPVVNTPAPTVPTVPTATNPFGGLGDLAGWMSLAAQMQQAGGGSGRNVYTGSNTGSGSGSGSNTGSGSGSGGGSGSGSGNTGGYGGWQNWYSGR